MIFCQATKKVALNVNGVLQKFVEGSGQFVNLEKNSAYFSSCCPQALRIRPSKVLGFKYQENFGKYLGI